jgi:hypothetical protein
MGAAEGLWAAYDLLLEELARAQEEVNRAGATAFAAGDHAGAASALARARELSERRVELAAWAERLRVLVAPAAEPPPETRAHVRGKLPKGLKTPQDAYRRPILSALVTKGGSAEMSAVLERVYAEMKSGLNEYDLAPMPSDPHMPRWRNTAQWCRNAMRKEGLIAADSPHGVWEISEKGREWVEEQG